MADTLCVLDASIAAPWFFVDEPTHRLSLRVRAEVVERPDVFVVPPLFHSELLHVLARKSGADAAFVASAIDLVLRLGIRTLPLSEAAWRRASHWACRGMSGYDATYVALAEDLSGFWLTSDDRAAKRAGPKHTRTLKNWMRRR